MEDEYEDAVGRANGISASISLERIDVGRPTPESLRRDITALEGLVADLRALLARAETEMP